MRNAEIDSGRAFDWGRVSGDYAKYRDIYPPEFYRRIVELGLCGRGQRVLDLGTGTGVLPRGLYRYGAAFTGVDISENQIAQARRLAEAEGMKISFRVSPAEEIDFPAESFDTVTACQCHFYFDHSRAVPQVRRILKPGGRYALLYMAWLPREDAVAGASEALVLRFNPKWSGRDETRRPIVPPPETAADFTVEHSLVFDLQVPFTRESWAGRIRACRGVGAALPPEELSAFETAHRELLERIAPDAFSVSHYAAITVLRRR